MQYCIFIGDNSTYLVFSNAKFPVLIFIFILLLSAIVLCFAIYGESVQNLWISNPNTPEKSCNMKISGEFSIYLDFTGMCLVVEICQIALRVCRLLPYTFFSDFFFRSP